jgi:flavocytochrome c
MAEELNGQLKISRRNFVKGAAIGSAAGLVVGGGGVALLGAGKQAASSLPKNWDKEADVIVVGGGGAGLSAAVSAAEQGGKVLLIEKAPMVGGDTTLSSQTILGAWPEKAKENGFEDSPEVYLTDLQNSHKFSVKGRAGEPMGDLSMVKYYTENIGDTLKWMEACGQQFALSKTVYGFYPKPQWETQQRCWFATKGVVPVMNDKAKAVGVEIAAGTRVRDLIVNEAGRVVGLYAVDSNGSEIACKAKKAVILASGAFNANSAMMSDYLPASSGSQPAGSLYGTGDGHLMTQKIGGQLEDLNLETHWFPFTGKTNTTSFTLFTAYTYAIPGILVNADAQRFTDENDGYATLGRHIARQKYRTAYFILDQTSKNAYDEMSKNFGITNTLMWTADTLESLADKILLDGVALKATVDKYNGYVDAGQDQDFKKILDGVTKLVTPPFAALEVVPKHYCTYGGISTDDQTHVLDKKGKPIAGLYAAGVCAGSIFEKAGIYYEGGVGQGAVFGRLAGKNAVADKPWDA